jgi:hypothetical protein
MDFDKKVPRYDNLCAELRKLGLEATSVCYSRSTQNWHVICVLSTPLPTMERFFAQLYLGSDIHRERWNFIRYVHYQDRSRFVQVLFGKKVKL